MKPSTLLSALGMLALILPLAYYGERGRMAAKAEKQAHAEYLTSIATKPVPLEVTVPLAEPSRVWSRGLDTGEVIPFRSNWTNWETAEVQLMPLNEVGKILCPSALADLVDAHSTNRYPVEPIAKKLGGTKQTIWVHPAKLPAAPSLKGCPDFSWDAQGKRLLLRGKPIVFVAAIQPNLDLALSQKP